MKTFEQQRHWQFEDEHCLGHLKILEIMNVLKNLFNFCLWGLIPNTSVYFRLLVLLYHMHCCKSSFLCWFPGSYQSNTGKVKNNGNIFDIKLI